VAGGRHGRRATPVARAALLLFLFFGVDKALGLVRQVIIGRQFGIGAELDAFNAANNLPDLLFALISGGALSIALIPVLSEWFSTRGRAEGWELFSRVANWAFVLTGALALLVAAFAGPLVRAEIGVAPGFTAERQALVTELMRLNLIATLLFSLSGLVMAGLQSNQHFLLPAIAPAVYDLGQIFGALVLAPAEPGRLGPLVLPAAGLGVHGLVYGVILGAGLHLAVQAPGLVRYRFRWKPALDLNHPGLRQVARLMAPRILTIGAFQIMFVVQDNLASRLEVGSVAALAYGWLIMQVPETLIGTAVATALLPTLAEQFARREDSAFGESVARAVRVLLAALIPLSLLLLVALRPLIQLAFDFDPRGTDLVTGAARAYLLGMTGHALLEVLARAFYARQSPRWPLIATGLRVALFLIVSLLLFRPLGPQGIALSNSLAFSLEAVLLLWLLSRGFPRLLGFGPSLARGLIAAGLGALAAWILVSRLPGPAGLAALAAVAAGSALAALIARRDLGELRAL
jgi:putative peptidoglycan lipid II flippase